MEDRSIGPRLTWYAHDARRRLGLPGVAGVATLVAALLFCGTAVWSAADDVAVLKKEIAVLDAAGKSPDEGAQKNPSDPGQQLEQFYRFFPKSSVASDDLARLHGFAAAHNVQLDQGTYRLVRDRAGKLSLYEITLPVKGDYPQLRKFMSQALTEIPYLALDGVSFQRQKAGDATLESQIKFTLFLTEAS